MPQGRTTPHPRTNETMERPEGAGSGERQWVLIYNNCWKVRIAKSVARGFSRTDSTLSGRAWRSHSPASIGFHTSMGKARADVSVVPAKIC